MAGGDILIDHKVLEGYLRKLYGGKFDVSKEIEPTIWREVLRLLNEATVEGLSQSQLPPTHEQEFYKELRHSNEVFAAFKVHKMGSLMALKLTDEDGKLKPYRQWKEDIKGISNHFLNAWLKTEYNTAVIRAHNAADWRQFERNKDIMPNLRWMPTVSPNPEAEHRVFWERKLTRPIDDPFWNKHRPGNRWNCKCSLEATDEPITPLPTDEEIRGDQPQRGLENNPGKDGQLFSKKHPYFPKNCRECGFNKTKGSITNWFVCANNSCTSCTSINEHLDLSKAINLVDFAANNNKTQRISHLFTSLSKFEISKLRSLGLGVSVEDIYISDDRIQHALRKTKVNSGKSVSPDDIKHFIKNVKHYSMFYDTLKCNIVYAVNRNNKTMKFVVKPNSKVKVNRKKVAANTFVTAGIIQEYNLGESHLIKIR